MFDTTNIRSLRARALELALPAAAALCSMGAFAQGAQPTIKVGVVLEVTGRLALYGESGKRGVEMAFDAFGRNSTVGGRKVELVLKDVQSEAQLVISALNDLTNSEKVNYLVGPCASPLVSAAIPAWRQKKPLWMQFCGTSTRLRDEVGAEANFFHTFPYGYHYHQADAAALRHYLGSGKKAVVIYSDDDLGRGHIAEIEKIYPEAGIAIAAKEVVRVGTTDFNPILTKLASQNPDVLIAMVQGGDLVTLAKQIHARKFRAPYRVTTSAAQFDTFVKAVGDEAAEGWIGPTTFLSAGVNRPADATYAKYFPSSTEWEERFRKRYAREPDSIDVGSYVTASMLLIALERAGSDDRDKVAAELHKLDVMTPLGRGKFQDSEGTKNQAFTNMIVFQRQAGKAVVVYPAEVAKARLLPVGPAARP